MAFGNEASPVPGPGGPIAVPLQHGRARVATSLRSGNAGLTALAVVVGAGAGLGAIMFRWLIETFTRAFTGYDDYAGLGHVGNPSFPALGASFVLLTPVVAGLLYGPLVSFFAREARGHGVPEVMDAVARRGGRIPPQVAGVKALASALCIGGGGSVGREGPIVQIGAALGSSVGQVVRMPEARLRVLVACGAAGGIAATFNAPLAGVFFAMELILRDFAARAFSMVVISSVTASVIARAALGNEAFLDLPTFGVDSSVHYLSFAVLGLLAGAVGIGFARILYVIEDLCDWAWRGPEWLRPAVGGLLLGGLLLLLPEMYGVGYPVLAGSIDGAYAIGFLVVLLVGKMVATSLTIGIGGSGGVFAPSLFIGAMLGSAFGQGLNDVAPAIAGAAGVYGLVGMGAVFAGSARAPITAVIILFELTGEYSIILPMMLAIALATGVSHLLSHDTIYTLKLRRRGVDLDAPPRSPAMSAVRVGDVLEPVGPTLALGATLSDAADAVAAAPHALMPVVDADGGYVGVATASALADALADGEHDERRLGSVVETPGAVGVDDSIGDALGALADSPGGVPVLDAHRTDLVGWLTHQRVLAALHAHT